MPLPSALGEVLVRVQGSGFCHSDVHLIAGDEELREVSALAEQGRLTPIDLEFQPLERINDAYERVKNGGAKGRIVITR